MEVRRGLAVVSGLAVLTGIGLVVMGVRAAPPEGVLPNEPMLAIAAKDGVAAFEIDAQEVSVAEYAACVRAGACTLHVSATSPESSVRSRHEESASCYGGRPDRADYAMNCVDFAEANAYCQWAGKRLPTLEEWQLAVGSKHPGGAGALHRARIGYLVGEWTNTGSGNSPRQLGAWLTEKERQFALQKTFESPLTRSHAIGFRCAR